MFERPRSWARVKTPRQSGSSVELTVLRVFFAFAQRKREKMNLIRDPVVETARVLDHVLDDPRRRRAADDEEQILLSRPPRVPKKNELKARCGPPTEHLGINFFPE